MDSEKKTVNNQSKSKSSANKSKSAKFNPELEGDLKKFFVEELKDIYFAEHEVLKGLKKMESVVTSPSLKESIQTHYKETQIQIKRLEKVFGMVDEKPAMKKCEGILGILEEGKGVLEDTKIGSMVRDAAIIISLQKVEHYEIATYGSLAELARTMGLDEVAEILEETLDEEKTSDVTLTVLAVESVNEEASEE